MPKNLFEKLIEENNGLLKTADAVNLGLSKSNLYQYILEKGLEKIAHGIYVSSDYMIDEMALLQAQYPKVIFSHETALYVHELTEKEPMPLSVTVPSRYNTPSLIVKGVKIHYIKKNWHSLGVCETTSVSGHIIRVYDMERSICDLVRKRKSTDIAVFNFALQKYFRKKNKDYHQLFEYAKELRMEKLLRDTIGVFL